MDASLRAIIDSVGIDDEDIQAVFQRPSSTCSACYTSEYWLYNNSVYGVLLQPGQAIDSWVTQHIGMNGSALPAEDILVITSLIDKNTCLGDSGSIIYLDAMPAVISLIEKSTDFASIVCIGPVQALRDDNAHSVAQIVEEILSFCLPRYGNTPKLPPVILFTDGDADDKGDISILRQYVPILSSKIHI